ncbi:hypothetical protein ACI1UH_06300 [Lactococcus formosensis subsp. bovis]|uniref:hypothetical protein n=1 Tax=Lactococcus TaxID=1357 RepID=UPI0002E5B73D|nr:hypothetical protein [Lactococcus petauri]
MELKCTDCMVTFEAPYDKDCPFCGTDAFVVEITNQPKLSIPKKIAEELEEYEAGEKGNYSLFSLSEEAREFYLTHNNIVTIYFASKALGVELVSIEG